MKLIMHQLALEIESQPQKPREYPPVLLNVFAKLRAENEKARAIAVEMFGPNVGELNLLPNEQFIPVWQEFHRREGTITKPLRNYSHTPSKVTPYRPWSNERKQRDRIHKLKGRILKRYSFPELWIDEMQRQLLKSPQYYGVCPLPNAANECALYLSDLIPNPTKLKEIELREAEYREYQNHLRMKKTDAN
jgi:hypothetical protein